MGQRGADRGRHRAVDAGHAPVGQHRETGPRGRGQRHVADRVRRAEHQRGALRQRRDERPGQPQARRRGRPGRGPRPARPSPPGPRRTSGRATAVGGVQRRHRADPAHGGGDVGPRGAGRVGEREHGDVGVGEQALDGSVQRRAARDDDLGRPQRRRGPDQPRPRPQRRRPRRRGGLGDDRHRPTPHLGRRAVPGDDERRRRGVERQRRGAALDGADGGPRAAAGPAGGRVAAAVGHQRLGEGQVEVHRAGRPAARPGRGGHRPADERPPLRVLGGRVDRDRRAGGEPHRAPEEARLADGLVGPGADQLRGPVGGQGEQRHAGVGRLQHRGVQVRRGRAGRRADRHRAAGPQREPEGQEPARALVDPHVQPQPARRVGRVQRERQRGVAGPGHSTASVTPQRTSSSTITWACAVDGFTPASLRET